MARPANPIYGRRSATPRRAWLLGVRRARSHAVLIAGLLIVQSGFANVPPVAAEPERSPEPDAPVLVQTQDGPQPAGLADITIPAGNTAAGALDPSIELRPEILGFDPPATRTEIVTARSERSRVIANPDGTFTLEHSLGRINYQDTTGAWQVIDLDLVPAADGQYGLQTKANDRVVRFDTDLGEQAIAEVSADGRTLRLRAPGTGTGSRTPDERHDVDRIEYPSVAGGPDIFVRPTTEGLEFGGTWQDATGPSFVDVVLDLDGYLARLAADGLTVELVEVPVAEPSPTPTPTPVPSPTVEPTPTPTPTPTGTPAPSASTVPTPQPSLPAPSPSVVPPSTSDAPSAPPDAIGGASPNPVTPGQQPAPDLLAVPTESPPVTAGPSQSPAASGGEPQSPDPSAAAGPSALASPIPSPAPEASLSATPAASPTTEPDPDARVIGQISAPTVIEGDGSVGAPPLTVSIVPDGSAGGLRIRYAIDPTWMTAPERQFPIVLDPSVCVQAGGSGCQTGPGTVVETYIGSGQPTTYPNPPSILRVGHDSLPDVDWNTLRTLIYFPHQGVTQIPDGAIITAATLRLRETDNQDASTTPQIYARAIDQTTWSNHSTWNDMSIKVRAGYDSPTQPPCQTNATDCDVTLDVEDAVRSWYTRRAKSWKLDNGFQIRLATESSTLDEIDFYTSSGCSNTTCPKLTIDYQVPHVGIDFDPALGLLYAPSTMIAGQSTKLPIIVTNNDTGWDFDPAVYRVGYRWFDAKGFYAVPAAAPLAFSQCIGTGTAPLCLKSLGPFALPVLPPSLPGQYTLRLDLARVDGSTYLWASDSATPSKYYSRNKKFLTPDDTRWVGSSVIERDEFSINVVAGGGSNSGELRTVTTGMGDSIGVNLNSKNLSFAGDTGLGFADRIPLSLRYGYDQVNGAGCAGYQGILGACGWWTTYDERITGGPVDTGYDYVYQDLVGDRYLLDTDSNGQITSGAPVLLNRPRHTLLDENEAPSASVLAVIPGSFPAFSGTYAQRALSNANAGTGLTDKVNLNVHKMVRFAMRTTSTPRSGLCLKIHNLTDDQTYDDRWWCYTVGSSWTTGFDQRHIGLDGGVASLSADWNDYTQDLWADIRSDGDFGLATDEYQVVEVQIQSDGTGSGYTYLDALRFESSETVILDDANLSTWTAGQSLTSAITPPSTDPPIAGTKVLRIDAPASPTTAQPTCRTSNSCWSTIAGDLGSYAFAHWSWKKVGGTTAAMVVYVRDQRLGAPCSTVDCSITYYAGEAPPPFATGLAIQVSATLPSEWTLVRRNILEDARTALGLFDDEGSGSGDAVRMTGYGPIAVDGSHLLLDHFAYGNLADVASVDPTGLASPKDRPTTVGDTTFVWDYTADYPDGSRHYFNRDGLLVLIRDRDGNAVTLDWTTSGATTGQGSYVLDKVRAPTDGGSAGGGTFFDREFDFSGPGTDGALSTIRVDENLGLTTNDRSSRAVIFERTTGGAPDLRKVSPARHIIGSGTSGTFCGSAPSGCTEFTYTDTTNHRLEYVADPRWTGGSGSSDYRFQVTRDGSGYPLQVKDRSHGSGGTALLNILAYTDTRDSSTSLYNRVHYQDAASAALNQAIAVELSSDGRLLTGYAPRPCTPTVCTTSGTWPSLTDLADYHTVHHEFDGLARVNTVRTYRCPTSASAVSGCTGTTELVSLSRQASNAGAKVDNYADPLASAEIAWRQSPDQAFASVRDTGGGNPDLYRTTYRYDGQHRVVVSREPVQLKASVYDQAIPLTPNATAWWRLDEASGNALSSIGSYPGTVTGATRNQGGALQRTTSPAYGFDGVDDRVAASLNVSQTAYTIEAWARPDIGIRAQAIAGDWASATDGAMLWTNPEGRYTLVHTATGANYLTPGPKASTGRWDHVVGTWSGTELRLYVNGELVGQKAMTIPPGNGASSFEIGATANDALYHYDGRIDEVAVYGRAIGADEVRAHYRAGLAVVTVDTQTIRDRAGHVLETSDQFVANGGLESGLDGWSNTGTVTATTTAARSGGLGATIPSGQSLAQRMDLVPGQALRLQYYQSGTGATLTGRIQRWDATTSAWVDLVTDANTSTTWAGHAWDVQVPIDSDGRLKLLLSATGTGSAYVDDVVLLTRWTTTSYVGSGTGKGLPSSVATLLPGCADCTQGSIKATFGYQAGSSPDFHPAIFPTTITANDVGTVNDPSSEDVISTSSYDPWGRLAGSTDPDGVASSTSYASNQTDVTSIADDPDNGAATTTYTYDAVGNRLTTTSPLGRATNTTYDALNRAVTMTGPDQVVASTDVNDFGQAIRNWANYVDGTTSLGDDDLLAVTTYDAFGRATRVDADCSASANVPNCAAGLVARTNMTYDLAGNMVDQTVYPGAVGTGTSRKTSAQFETTAPTAGPYAGQTLARLSPSGVRLPIIAVETGTPWCPGNGGLHCNSVSVVDLSGRTIATTDAYGVTTTVDLDLDGRVVRTIVNDTAGTSHGTGNDENLVTLTRYDLLGRVDRTTSVIDGGSADRWTRTVYDPLGRATETFSGFGSGTLTDRSSTRTRYTTGGRVERVSSTEAAGTSDTGRAWTRTEYDADGRAVRTIEHAETGGSPLYARSFVDHMEGDDTPGWSVAASGAFTIAAGVLGPVFDEQGTSSVAPRNGRHRIRAFTNSGSAASGIWRDYSGRTFLAGRTYRLRADVWVASGSTLRGYFGVDGSPGSSYVEVDTDGTTGGIQPITGASAWQSIQVDWTPASTVYTNVHFALVEVASGSVNIYVDDVMVYDTGATDLDIAVETAYDKDGRVIASILPPGDPAIDRPMVTTSAFDAADRVVLTSTNAREPYAAAVQATGNVSGQWTLDEAGGVSLDDRSSTTDLTATGGPVLGVAGGIDEARTAIRFDGSNDYASRSSAVITNTNDFALEAWFRYASVPGTEQVIAYNGILSAGWGIGFKAGKLQGLYGGTWLDTGQTPSAGVWHHVVLTRASGTTTIYLDGVASTPTNSTTAPAAPGANFSIGRQDGSGNRYVAGDIDEVAVYNAAMSSTSVTAHLAAGRQSSTTDALTTRSVYDRLGRVIETADPARVRTTFEYDRLGALVATTKNHIDGAAPVELAADDVRSEFGRDVLGELVGYCSGKNLWDAANAGGPAVCDPTISTNQYTWRYSYDAMGRMTLQRPPTVAGNLAPTEWVYESGGRLAQSCIDTDATVCGAPSRWVEYDQDALGRTTVTRAKATSLSTITTTTTYDVDGQTKSVSEGSTTFNFTYDPQSGLPDLMKLGASTVLTDYGWAADGTLSSRTDGTFGTSTYGYDWANRLVTLSAPATSGYDPSAETLEQSWRNDGLLQGKVWPNEEIATLAYDSARRPTAINLTGSRSLSRSYDRVGNVVSDNRALNGGIGTPAGAGELTYTYDPLGRLTETKLDTVMSATYTYDRSSNRRSKVEGGDTFAYTFNPADTLATQTRNGTTLSLVYDAAGNLTTERTKAGAARTYAYDAASRLITLTPATGNNATFTYDPLDRIAQRAVGGGPGQTFGYVGTSDVAWGQPGSTSLIGPGGSRVGTKTGAVASWLLFDLLGSVAGAETAGTPDSTAITDAFRYDAYGQTIGTYPAGGSSQPVRFRGLIDIAPTADPDVTGAGSDPLYVMGARLYAPHLGAFTSFDSYAGTAQDPASMNRYLYAHANPTTLIDPTGHLVIPCNVDDYDGCAPGTYPVHSDGSKANFNDSLLGGSQTGGTGTSGNGAGSSSRGNNKGKSGTTSTGTTEVAAGADPSSGPLDLSKALGDVFAWTYEFLTTDICAELTPDGQPRCESMVIPFGFGKVTGPQATTKAVNLPAWKHVNVDMAHVMSGHIQVGSRWSSIKTVFSPTATEGQLRAAIKEAYEHGTKAGASQGDRILLQGQGGGYVIRMWFNTVTQTIETAYPVFP